MFACYCRYDGKTLQAVLETHVFRPALWIKEGIINTIIVILLVKDICSTKKLIFRMPERVGDHNG